MFGLHFQKVQKLQNFKFLHVQKTRKLCFLHFFYHFSVNRPNGFHRHDIFTDALLVRNHYDQIIMIIE